MTTKKPAAGAAQAADEKADAQAKAEAEAKAAQKSGNGIEGVWVRSVTQSFRRAGFAFNRLGCGIALDALEDEQLAALEGEPNLVVERVTFEDESLTKPEK